MERAALITQLFSIFSFAFKWRPTRPEVSEADVIGISDAPLLTVELIYTLGSLYVLAIS